MADYQRAVKALSLIVAANSREQLLLASKDMDVLVTMFILPPMLGSAPTALPPHQEKKMLQLMCSAYAKVTDLVTGPLHDDFTEDFMLRLTSVLLGSLCVVLKQEPATITGYSGRWQLSEAQVMSSTGLLTALTAACTEFAKQLMRHRANHDMVYHVAVTTIHAVNILMLQWPGKRVLGRVFPPLLLRATRLALVMAQLPNPADEAPQSSNSGQQSTNSSESFPSWSQLDLEHLIFAGNLMDALQGDILHLKQADFLQHISAAQHILESRDVQELCVALFATMIRKLHIDLQGGADSRATSAHAAPVSSGGRASARSNHPDKQHPAVAASHDKVLALLGCRNTRTLHGNLQDVHRIKCCADAVYQLLTYRIRLPHHPDGRPKQMHQQPPLPLPVWEALLLLYVELQLLSPTAETVMVSQASIYNMCTLPAAEVASWAGEFTAAGRGLSAAVAEAMLLLVPSAVQVAKQKADISGDRDAKQILESFGFGLWAVLAITLERSTEELLRKQPEAAAAALEMAVRGVSIDTWVKMELLDKFLSAMRNVLTACPAIVQDQHSSAKTQPEQQQSQQDKPLLQLALTCLKVLRRIPQIPGLNLEDMLEAVACANTCVLLAAGCKPLSVSSEQWEKLEPQCTPHTAAASAPPLTFTASDSSNSVLLPLVTAARGLEILGCCLEKLVHTCKASDLLPGSKVTTDLQINLFTCCSYIEWVCLQLWTVELPTLDAPTRTTLVDMCKEIRGLIDRHFQRDVSPLGTVSGMLRRCQHISKPEAMAAELGPKLQLLGAAVCSVLPISSCCSNHQCVNTAHYTEQQLVGGKGSLCGGCRTARYCSAACQKKHWSKHKAVCNTIKQARLRSSARGNTKA